jgi:hypothetical protein
MMSATDAAPEAAMEIRIYDDINIPANFTSAFADVQIPAGNWRVVSLMALASVAGVVTRDIDTMITLAQADRLRATESGAVEPIISGGVLRATATKKVPLGAALVRVIISLEQI